MNNKKVDLSNLQEDLFPNRKAIFAHSAIVVSNKDSITIFPKSGGEVLDGITFTPAHMRRLIDVAQKKLEEIKSSN
jgi:hypothetical protein